MCGASNAIGTDIKRSFSEAPLDVPIRRSAKEVIGGYQHLRTGTMPDERVAHGPGPSQGSVDRNKNLSLSLARALGDSVECRLGSCAYAGIHHAHALRCPERPRDPDLRIISCAVNPDYSHAYLEKMCGFRVID